MEDRIDDGYRRLMFAICEDAVKESIDNYRKGKSNIGNEQFFKNSFVAEYCLPDMPADVIIEALRAAGERSK